MVQFCIGMLLVEVQSYSQPGLDYGTEYINRCAYPREGFPTSKLPLGGYLKDMSGQLGVHDHGQAHINEILLLRS